MMKAGRPRYFNREIATDSANPLLGYVPTFGGRLRIYTQDQLLQRIGGTDSEAYGIYIDLLNDSHVLAVMQKQISFIVSRPPIVKPGGDTPIDKAAAEFCQSQLAQLDADITDSSSGNAILSNANGFEALCRGLLMAVLTGIQPAEIVYRRLSTGQIGVDYAKLRDIRLFQFDADEYGNIYPMLRTKGNAVVGEHIPPKKFVFHRHWAIQSTDPLGAGLARYLYYPVQWKREALTYWLVLLDKHADPPAIGTYPRSASDSQIQEFYSLLSQLGRDSRAALQEGFSLAFPASAGAGNTAMLEKLVAYCDKAISLAVLGEATTGEQLGGSQAREAINNSIRLTIAKSWSDSLASTLQSTLLKWLTDWNFPGAAVPRLERNFTSATDILAIAKDYKTLGYNVPADFLSDATGVPIEPPKPKRGSEPVKVPPNLLK